MRKRLILHETGFTRWSIFASYFIDVDTFYFFLNWFSSRVSDDRNYVYGRRLYACIVHENSRAQIPEKLHHFQRSKKWFTCTSFQSSPKTNRMLKPLHYFRPHLWFFLLYFRPEALEPRRWRGGVEGGGEAVTTRTRLVGVNIKREMVLSPNDEEVASSKKHTQFKTRVTKVLG